MVEAGGGRKHGGWFEQQGYTLLIKVECWH